MSRDSTKLLDPIGWRLLEVLQQNARLSLAEIGRLVGLSAAGVADRIRRYEDAGIIGGYHAHICPEAVGLSVKAFLHLRVPVTQTQRFLEIAQQTPEIHECSFVTGEETYIAIVYVESLDHLAEVIEHLRVYGEIVTSLVLKTPISSRLFGPNRYHDH
ncbi:AsnC family transcriptional regulator [Dictyobacter alpinus]|uniref:AsnC family transcriptional regulator n=1 Tax=Dictyobacter alpinus TaxID=2014873 RepID=A0A402B7Y0_9CHLR|nr:Lrp/AsnC family transcriptional regulator [Dictyobacter alpinus]GCE27523.1 AsnC family transcriptional regulator [Dictyobacter alpinus]